MEKIYIQASEETPEINFDFLNNYYSIKGASIPENALSFYGGILNELNNYHKNTKTKTNATVDIMMEYFNTASGKMLLQFFEAVAKINKQNKTQCTVNWKLTHEDEDDILDFIETVEELSELKINRNYN